MTNQFSPVWQSEVQANADTKWGHIDVPEWSVDSILTLNAWCKVKVDTTTPQVVNLSFAHAEGDWPPAGGSASGAEAIWRGFGAFAQVSASPGNDDAMTLSTQLRIPAGAKMRIQATLQLKNGSPKEYLKMAQSALRVPFEQVMTVAGLSTQMT